MDDSIKNDIFFVLGTIATSARIHGEDINIQYDDNDNKSDSSSSRPSKEDKPQNALSVKSMVKDKAIEMYAKKQLDNLKKTLKGLEPFDAGSLDKETISDKDFKLSFQLKNIKLFNLGSFVVKKFKSMSNDSSAEFSMAVPSVRTKANYSLNGTFRGKKVDGSGEAEIQISDVTIDNGRVVIKETPQEIQISSFKFCYDFKKMTIKQTGLNIEDLKSDEVSKFLNTTVTKYLKDNKARMCERIASEMRQRINAKLKGKNRDQLSDMMK